MWRPNVISVVVLTDGDVSLPGDYDGGSLLYAVRQALGLQTGYVSINGVACMHARPEEVYRHIRRFKAKAIKISPTNELYHGIRRLAEQEGVAVITA